VKIYSDDEGWEVVAVGGDQPLTRQRCH